jgi:hypothetical protein
LRPDAVCAAWQPSQPSTATAANAIASRIPGSNVACSAKAAASPRRSPPPSARAPSHRGCSTDHRCARPTPTAKDATPP